ERHVVVVCVVPEKLLPGLGDVLRMLEQAVRVDVALPYLACGSVVAQEPVVAEGLRVLLPRLHHHLGRLALESFELAVADLHSGSHFEHGLLLSFDVPVHTCFGTCPANTRRMILWPKSAVVPNIKGQPPSMTVMPC